ncbi:MAG TPA: DNA polymerase III subunit epsilon, partial [Xanthomonadales bacterium]
MRQIVLDTETTGLDPRQGHRIIEIGALELVDRQLTGKQFHVYINPEREIEQGALEVHGITEEFLRDKPLFAEISDEFMAFAEGAELVIHNAPFDVGFIDNELSLSGHRHASIAEIATVLDTLELARDLH